MFLTSSSLVLIVGLNVLLIYTNSIACNNGDIVSVRINKGLINGKIERSSENQTLYVFRGIPYAEPPVGRLRFKKTQPLAEWPEVVDAFDWPNSCYQSRHIPEVFDMFYNSQMSEDCLYLNIMAPESSLQSDRLRPVIFYIHMGGFFLGSGSLKYEDMRELTVRGDVVTVSINYRLTTFGFLYTATDEAPGNSGLWDQAMALEWVNDNIRYFGGDPTRITIMGLSAGGWSVSLHLLSPITRHLYNNAILQSGAYVKHMIDGQTDNLVEWWLKASQLIGCNDDQVTDKFTEQITECLMNADPDLLSSMVDKVGVILNTGFFPMVAVDGQFLPNKPTEMLRSGDFKQNVNILFSTAADEGTMVLLMLKPELLTKNITYDEAYEVLSTFARGISNKVEVDGELVARLYLDRLASTSEPGLLKRTIATAIGDFIVGCPAILFAKEVFRNSGFRANVYQYHWNRKVKTLAKNPLEPPEWAGPRHVGDAYPSHGIPFIAKDSYSDEERERSQQMMKMITDFVNTGKPSAENGQEWPKYYAIDDNIIAPFYEFTASPKSDTNFGVGLKINECEYLWQKYLM